MDTLKKFWKDYGHRIYICIDIGILFMGIFMLFLGMYKPVCGTTQNDARAFIGEACIAVWFILFPAVSREKKDRIASVFTLHIVLICVMFFVFFFAINYLINNMERGDLVGDILFCISGILLAAYFLYILVGVIKMFFKLMGKVMRFIFPKIKEATGVINVIEAITAAMLSITALGASIIGIINMVKQFRGI